MKKTVRVCLVLPQLTSNNCIHITLLYILHLLYGNISPMTMIPFVGSPLNNVIRTGVQYASGGEEINVSAEEAGGRKVAKDR